MNGFGPARGWVDGDEDQVYAASFAPFGEVTGHSGSVAKPWGYAGEYLEPASGLIYLRARWYDPVDGRFLTRDPFAGIPSVPGTLNPYAYALDNPVMVTDPSGQVVPLLALIALGLAGGALGGVGYYGIESAANADPCTGMEWDWNQAAFWGTIGMPIGAVVAVAGYPALTSALGMTLSEALGIGAASAAAAEHLAIDWFERNPNNVSHIMEHKHAWGRLTELSGDMFVDYKRIQPFLELTIRTGESKSLTTQQGTILVRFLAEINGETVVVRAIETGQNMYQISDAWVETRW